MVAFLNSGGHRARFAHLGFTLLELVLGVIIITFAGSALLRAYGDLLPRGPSAAQVSQANQLAQERLAIVLGQRAGLGYLNLVDPCVASPTATVCVAPSGFAVSISGATSGESESWPLSTDTQEFRVLQVMVVETASTARTLAVARAILANY